MINSKLSNLTINLIGNNTLDGKNNNDGIDASGGCNITITGNGTLTMDNIYYGTYIGSYDTPGGDLTIKDTNLNITSAQCAGIWVNHDINFINSKVAVTKTNDSYQGVVSNIGGTITLNGGDVTINTVRDSIHMSNSDDSKHDITINSGNLTLRFLQAYGIHI